MSKDDNWAFKPIGAEKNTNSVFEPCNSHSDFGKSSSSDWNFGRSESETTYWGYDNGSSSKANFHSSSGNSETKYFGYSVGNESRNSAFSSGGLLGNPSSSLTASCDSHLLDLKARERNGSANHTSGFGWTYADMNSLGETRGIINHYENKRNGSNGLFRVAKQSLWGQEPVSGLSDGFDVFAPTKLKKGWS